MIETIKKKSFKNEKSQYLFELFKSEKGYYYVEFSQTIEENFLDAQTLKLREADIDKLISILHELQSDIEEHKCEQSIVKPNSEKAKKIYDYYFNKNIPIDQISMILNLKEKAIEKVLLDHKVPIVSTKPPVNKYYRRKRNR